MAGKVSGAIKAMGIVLAQDQKRQILALDEEFAQLEAKIETLKSENLKLKASVNPLEREVQRLRQIVDEMKTSAVADKLPDEAAAILMTVANHEVTKEQIIAHLKISTAKGDYYFDQLEERRFIIQAFAEAEGTVYRALPAGREYLAKRGLLD